MELATFTSDGVVADTRRGLLDDPKWLSSLYFYDRAGSQLFEQICTTPEYYPTRTERAILAVNAEAILDAVGPEVVLAELGSGSSDKTRTLLAALRARQTRPTYLPVDVSARFLADVATRLATEFSGLQVHPIPAEYGEGLSRIGAWPGPRRLVLFLGSSIGNFEPPEQAALLRAAHDALQPGDAFLLGTDMVKDAAVLHAAYNDAQGITAAFNRNILHNLNRRLGGDADPDTFLHIAYWDPERSRIEMHLESTVDQVLRFPGADLTVPLRAGERIHTENSYKFTPADITGLANAAGMTVERTWQDPKDWFRLSLLRRD